MKEQANVHDRRIKDPKPQQPECWEGRAPGAAKTSLSWNEISGPGASAEKRRRKQ